MGKVRIMCIGAVISFKYSRKTVTFYMQSSACKNLDIEIIPVRHILWAHECTVNSTLCTNVQVCTFSKAHYSTTILLYTYVQFIMYYTIMCPLRHTVCVCVC